MSAHLAILGVLLEGKSFGLEIIEKVEKRSGGTIKLSQGSVYPALQVLEKKGLLKSFESEPMAERGGRPRRYYELTGEGRKAALQQREVVGRVFGLVPSPA